MDSTFSDSRDTIARLREAARRGDWRSASELAAILPRQAVPASQEELGEYLRCLKEALVVAKASRAHAASSLARLNAAAGFHRAVFQSGLTRQNIGESPESWRSPGSEA